jgi:hypothetical protein
LSRVSSASSESLAQQDALKNLSSLSQSCST